MTDESGSVAAVSRNDAYTFTKPNRDEIVLVAGLGVEGDIHAGVNVRHRSRVAVDPSQPNLRQVHLIQAELFDEVAGKGYEVPAGGLGENVTTRGIDLLALPRGTILRFGTPPRGTPIGDAEGEGALGDDATSESAPSRNTTGPDAVVVETGEPAVERAAEPGTGVAAGLSGPVAAVLAAAAAASLDEATARAAEAVAAAVARDAARGAVAGMGDATDSSAGTGVNGGAGVGAATEVDGRAAVVVCGLRNPCAQINRFRPGLLKEVLGRDDEGNTVRRAGVMGVVLRGGVVRPGDPVVVELPPGTPGPLERV